MGRALILSYKNQQKRIFRLSFQPFHNCHSSESWNPGEEWGLDPDLRRDDIVKHL